VSNIWCPNLQRTISLSCKRTSKPILFARVYVTVAGSCIGSPTINSLEGPCWKAIHISGSLAAMISRCDKRQGYDICITPVLSEAVHMPSTASLKIVGRSKKAHEQTIAKINSLLFQCEAFSPDASHSSG
jgi:hypothetical protein